MSIFFSGSEILEFALAIERNGEAFYQSMSEKTGNKDAKAIYNHLAGEERKHLKTFRSMQDSAGKFQPPESYPGEYMLYLKSLVDNAVFTDSTGARQTAEKMSGEIEAIDIGIRAEKDSILFYTELQDFVGQSDRNVVHNIIDEEKLHLRQLSELKKLVI